MLRRVFLLAATCCAIRSVAAFSPAALMALGTNTRACARGLARKNFRPATLPALRMADKPDQVIDFGKVGFSEAENQVCTHTALSPHATATHTNTPGTRPAI
jgi:hypothetical protein